MAAKKTSSKKAKAAGLTLADVANDALKQAGKDGAELLKDYGTEATAELDAQLAEIGKATAARIGGSMSADDFAKAMESHENARASLIARVTDVKQRQALKALLKNAVRFAMGIAGGIGAMPRF